MGVDTTFSSYINPKYVAILPEDVHRTIIEMAALWYPDFAVRMSRTSSQLKKWTERIIYHDLYFDSEIPSGRTTLDKFQLVLHSRPAEFFATHVRTVHFDGKYDAASIAAVLRVCTGVQDLGIYASGLEAVGDEAVVQVFDHVHALPLRSLFISGGNLSALDTQLAFSLMSSSSSSSLHLPESSSLRTLRRLCLTDSYKFPPSLFPSLTHLAIVPDYENHLEFLRYIYDKLENPKLESVVVTHLNINSIEQYNVVRSLRDVTDGRLKVFTLPMVPTKFIEDDIWDLADLYPDEWPSFGYIDEIPTPKILTYDEMMALEQEDAATDSRT